MEEIVRDKDAKMWAMWAHLSALAGYIIPFGNIIGPIVIWSMKKNEYEFVNDQGKEAVNFQISVLIYYIISAILIILIIGIFMLIAVAIFSLIVTILAGLKANEGVRYRYPMCIRFIK